MRVLLITQYFPPETGAAPARALHFARALARAGHSVRVVTGLPNHPSGIIPESYRGVRRAHERWDDIEVERVWLHATPRRTAWTRLWNHVTFAWSALPAACAGPRPDVVLASVPPPFLGLSAWVAALAHRAIFVLDCRDDWPHAAIALGELKPGLVTRVLDSLARFLYLRAARVLAVTPGMRRSLERRGLDAGRIELVTNGADTDLFHPAARNGGAGTVPAPPSGGARAFTVLYAGTHGLVHGMGVLLDAAERLRARADVRFVLVGDGVAKPELQARAAAAGLDRIEFRPSLSPSDLVAVVCDADVCVATTRAHPFCAETIPVKLFDYLACGRPIVAAVSGDAADLVRDSGGGVVVAPEDGAALAQALTELADDPSLCARLSGAGPAYVEAHYSRRALGARMVAVLEDVHRRALGRPVTPVPAGASGILKRAADLLGAAIGLVLLSPLLLATAIAVKLDSPGPALFRQRRIGRGSAEFTILRFRTLHVGTPDLASDLMGPSSSRVTRLGRLLRRTSIDELPQLWNILRGQMSLVGPRPALYNQDELVELRRQAGVDALRPGVTGWAQVNGRDEIALKDKVGFDRYYLQRCSPRLDFSILVRTVFTLFSSRGVY